MVADGSSERQGQIRLAELLASLSLATDLAYAFPLEKTLRSTLLAVGLARELGLPKTALADTYYAAMLAYIGCTGPALDEAASFGGDDIGFRSTFRWVDYGLPAGHLVDLLAAPADGAGSSSRAEAVAAFVTDRSGRAARMIEASCEAGDRLADRLDTGPGVRQALGEAFERWDGHGLPRNVAGADLSIAGRIMHVAHVAEICDRSAGREAAVREVRGRRGGHFDPAIADAFLDSAARLLAPLEAGSIWDEALAAEPEPRLLAPESRLEPVCRAFGDFADLKSPFRLGHSAGVGELAAAGARRLGMADAEVTGLHRAGLLHDLGRVSVPNGIWDKPGSLGPAEWERVRLYPYYTERVLSRSGVLIPLARVAGMHQERLDGSGYHRGVPAALLPAATRVLAAADAYQAMLEDRPHRPALSPDAAAGELRADAAAGRLDREAVGAVLEAAGHRGRRVRATWPGGLSGREVEVLRLVARGRSNKAIGDRLSISDQTVRHHVLHIYAKIGVSTRAGAALFAMENDLLRGEAGMLRGEAGMLRGEAGK